MEVKAPNGQTALLIALNRGKTPIVEMLVTKGSVNLSFYVVILLFHAYERKPIVQIIAVTI